MEPVQEFVREHRMVLAHDDESTQPDLGGECRSEWYMAPAVRPDVMGGEMSPQAIVELPTRLWLEATSELL